MPGDIRQELLNPGQVAHMIGMGYKRFCEWLKEHPDFPKPVQFSVKSRKWYRWEVEMFIARLPRAEHPKPPREKKA